jgi:diguanylate cyclase (GGDEF)-like protein/PAS domain S-box-containing protein
MQDMGTVLLLIAVLVLLWETVRLQRKWQRLFSRTQGIAGTSSMRDPEQFLDHWEAVARSTMMAVIALDLTGKVVGWNLGAQRIYGFAPGEALGRTVDLVLPEECRRDFQAMLDGLAAGEPGCHAQSVHVNKLGARLDVAFSLSPMSNNAGQPRAASLLVYDITPFKQVERNILGVDRGVTDRVGAEKVLVTSEMQYRTTLESMPEAISVVDRDLRIVLANRALREWLRTLGSQDDVIGQDLGSALRFLPGISRGDYRHVFEHGEILISKETIDAGGKHMVYETRKIPVMDGDGVVRVVTVVRDITGHEAAEDARWRSEEGFRKLWNEAPVAYHTVDPDGIITRVNRTEAEMLGYRVEEMLGRSIFEFVAPEQREDALRRFRLKRNGENPPKAEDRLYVRKDGTKIPVAIDDALEHDEAGQLTGIRSTMVDISEQVRLREELRSLSLEDPLTGLRNRRGFYHLANQQLRLARRNRADILLLYADVDSMKWINDSLGHAEGDRALIEAAGALRHTFRESDIIARLGGDEFAVLVLEAGPASIDHIRDRVEQTLADINAQPDRPYELSLSMGFSAHDPSISSTLDDMIREADAGMYEDKRRKTDVLPGG